MNGQTPTQAPTQFGYAVTVAFVVVLGVALAMVVAAAAMPRTTTEHVPAGGTAA